MGISCLTKRIDQQLILLGLMTSQSLNPSMNLFMQAISHFGGRFCFLKDVLKSLHQLRMFSSELFDQVRYSLLNRIEVTRLLLHLKMFAKTMLGGCQHRARNSLTSELMFVLLSQAAAIRVQVLHELE